MLDKLKLPEQHYLHDGHTLRSWLLTKDHKRIAIMYLMSISVMFFIGGMFGVGIRLELATPQGDFVTADTYNKFFTMHGVIMVFFFLIPSIPAVLGNFLIPPMIGPAHAELVEARAQGQPQLSSCLKRLRTSPSISASRVRRSSIRRTA